MKEGSRDTAVAAVPISLPPAGPAAAPLIHQCNTAVSAGQVLIPTLSCLFTQERISNKLSLLLSTPFVQLILYCIRPCCCLLIRASINVESDLDVKLPSFHGSSPKHTC